MKTLNKQEVLEWCNEIIKAQEVKEKFTAEDILIEKEYITRIAFPASVECQKIYGKYF